MSEVCDHIEETEIIGSEKYYCEECIKTGDKWVHLRICQTCGKVHCCDSSPNTHATKHFHLTGHPVISSAEPGEKWLWCYKDKMFAKY